VCVCVCVCVAAQWATHYDEMYLNMLAALFQLTEFTRKELINLKKLKWMTLSQEVNDGNTLFCYASFHKTNKCCSSFYSHTSYSGHCNRYEMFKDHHKY